MELERSGKDSQESQMTTYFTMLCCESKGKPTQPKGGATLPRPAILVNTCIRGTTHFTCVVPPPSVNPFMVNIYKPRIPPPIQWSTYRHTIRACSRNKTTYCHYLHHIKRIKSKFLGEHHAILEEHQMDYNLQSRSAPTFSSYSYSNNINLSQQASIQYPWPWPTNIWWCTRRI